MSALPVFIPIEGTSTTDYQIPDDYSLLEHIQIIKSDWQYHSHKVASWVECEDSPSLASILSDEFKIPVGRPGSQV